MSEFMPEGALINTVVNKNALSSLQGLKEAAAKGLILESRVTLCDKEHNLIYIDFTVDLDGGSTSQNFNTKYLTYFQRTCPTNCNCMKYTFLVMIMGE